MRDSPKAPGREQLEEYRRLQSEMAQRVLEVPLQHDPQVIAAVDVHLRGNVGVAVAVAVSFPELETIEQSVVRAEITFPYIPGLLSFREAPLCLDALRSLRHQPDLILVDGQGRAHPRRFGIACHVGVELEIPSIGVAKSILSGRYESLGSARGSTAPLLTRGEIVGMAVRTRSGVSPVYVSVGNLITLEEAVNWTLNAVQQVRLPEPSRRAHRIAQQLAREMD